jgi:hypothetical protein
MCGTRGAEGCGCGPDPGPLPEGEGGKFALRAHCGRGRPRSQHQRHSIASERFTPGLSKYRWARLTSRAI